MFDFEAFPVLATRRLILRRLELDDAPGVFRIRGDHEVTRYNTGAAYQRLEQAVELIHSMTQAYQDKEELRWGITLRGGDDSVIGMCGYNYWYRRDARASVGYDLARAYWNQGIMTEALAAVIAFGFEGMGLNRIEADADVRNPASGRVLLKLGFHQEGLQREQFFDQGGYHDLVLFALLKKDYRKEHDHDAR